MRRFTHFLIVVGIGFCCGCSKPSTALPSAAPTPTPAPAAQPVPITLPFTNMENPQVDREQPKGPAAANPIVASPASVTVTESKSSEELKKLGLLFYYDEEPSFQILAPPSADYACTRDGRSMCAFGPQFNLQIDYGSYDFKALADKFRDMANVTIIDEQKDSLIIKKQVADPDDSAKLVDSHGVFLNRTVGNRDFRIYSLDVDQKSKPCRYRLTDVQRMLRSGSTLELARPLPTDPAALCKKLKIDLSHRLYGETIEQKEIVRADLPLAETTDSMLPLLSKFPSLIEVKAGSSPPPVPGEFDVKGRSWSVLSQLPHLKRLDFNSRDANDDAVAVIAQLNSLNDLEIGNWTLRLESIKPLEKLANLETLWINADLVTDSGLEQFPLFPKLRKLRLAAQNSTAEEFTGVGLRRLQMLPQLRDLELDAGPCGEAGFQQLGQIASLVELSVASNNLTDAGLAHLKSLVNLEKLELGSEKITDVGMVHLSGLTKLKSLDLSSVPVTDEGLPHLKTLTNLETLGLADTKVTDVGMSHLSHFKNLKTLYLGRTGITSAGIDSLLALTQLEFLSLSGTKITATNLERLGTLKSLKTLFVGVAPPLDEGIIAKLKAALPKCSIFTN
ncbi:MAG: inlA 1 [Planctomycetaceae bacterium]|nr:inlA 1 [Planctomycetaceae bacterium]